METRKQFRGNCQCCGRLHAVLHTGRMAKHGYIVKEYGFHGVCAGDNYEPMQKDRTASNNVVTAVRTDSAKMENIANSYREGKAHPVRVDKSYAKRDEDKTIAWEDAREWEKKDGIKTAIYRLESRARSGRDFADMLENLANTCYGQELMEVKVEAAKAPIEYGEKRKAPNGKILRVVNVQGARVYWKDERGFSSWTGSSAWRKYEIVTA